MVAWYLFAIASALISGLVPGVNKAILNGSDNALEFSSIFAAINALLVMPLLLVISLDAIPAKTITLLFAGSAFGALGFLYISKSMKTLDVSVVSPLTNFNPLAMVVLASLILGERLVARQFLGIMLVLLGAYFLERIAGGVGGKRVAKNAGQIGTGWAFAFVFASALFYGFSSVIDKSVLATLSPLQYMLLAHLFIAANFAILSCVWNAGRRGWLEFLTKAGRFAGKNAGLFALSSTLTLAYRLLQANAISLAPVSLVMPIRYLGSLVSIAVGGRLFREERLPEKMMVGLVMLAGTYFIIL